MTNHDYYKEQIEWSKKEINWAKQDMHWERENIKRENAFIKECRADGIDIETTEAKRVATNQYNKARRQLKKAEKDIVKYETLIATEREYVIFEEETNENQPVEKQEETAERYQIETAKNEHGYYYKVIDTANGNQCIYASLLYLEAVKVKKELEG